MRDVLLSIRSIDTELHHFIGLYGRQIYILLFLVIFAKTAYVIFTFLPGDATLFASGTIAAIGQLDIRLLLILFIVATFAGDSHNFLLGTLLKRAKGKKRKYSLSRLVPDKSIHKASKFLAEYGKLTIMFSRFIPLLSATVPFVSGFTGYPFKTFFSYNIMGAFIWTMVWVLAGYGLGNIDWVSSHLFVSLIAITLLSFIPPICAFMIKLLKNKEATES